jgi:hypothetical protein
MLTVVDLQLGFYVKSLSLHKRAKCLVYRGGDVVTLHDWLVRSFQQN